MGENNNITVQHNLNEPSLKEIKIAVEWLKEGKASGEDYII